MTTTADPAVICSQSTPPGPWPLHISRENLADHRPLIAKFLIATHAQIAFYDGAATISVPRNRAPQTNEILRTARAALLTALAGPVTCRGAGCPRETDRRQPATAGDHRG